MIDDSNRTKRKQAHSVTDFQIAHGSADILARRALWNRLDCVGLSRSVTDHLPVTNNANAAKLRRQLRRRRYSSACFGRGLRHSLSFAFQFCGATRSLSINFQTRRAVFDLSREFSAAFFKFFYRPREFLFK